MGSFSTIRPADDIDASTASKWCDNLIIELSAAGHSQIDDLRGPTGRTCANILNIVSTLKGTASLICYFGHGTEDSWLTNFTTTIDSKNIHAGAGKSIVSIACKTARNLGPDAITAGVEAWLGFTCKLLVLIPYKTVDPIGDAMVDGLKVLGSSSTMQDARDEISKAFTNLANDYDTGRYRSHPAAAIGYFGAKATAALVVVHGKASYRPL